MEETVLVSSQDVGQKAEELLLSHYPERFHFFFRHPLLSALGIMVPSFILQLVVTLVVGHFHSTNDVLGWADDEAYIPTVITATIAIFYSLWMPHHVRKTLDQISANNVFRNNQISINAQTVHAFSSKLSQWFLYGSTISLWLVASITVLPFPSNKTWANANITTLITTLILWIPICFSIGSLLVSYTLTLKLFNNIFSTNKVIVYPLHHDQCGGFSPLGNYSFKLTFLGLSLGVWIAIGLVFAILRDRTPVILADSIGMIFYLSLVPILFYLPLHKSHKVMTDFRNNLIEDISKRYSEEHLSLNLVINGRRDSEALETRLKHLEHLKELQKHARDYPIWPFDIKISIGVFINTIIPLFVTLIGLSMDVLDMI
jgi:hypothetical protein